MKKIKKEDAKHFAVDLALIFVACCIGSFSTVSIMIPNGLTGGGVTGIVRILQNYVNLNFSIMYYAGAFIILVLCALLLGFKEARKIILLTIMYPAVMMVFEHLDLHLLEESDMFLAAIYCGVFSGLCNGIVMSRGYSFGGSDTVAKIIQKRCLPHIALSKILLVLDASVIIASALVYGRNVALYALVTTMIVSKVIDFYMFGLETKIVQLEIITECPDEIAEYIMSEIGRGVSKEMITGGYTNQSRPKLMVLCSPRESVLIRNFVAQNDKQALITIIAVDSVWGKGAGFKLNE